MKNESVKDLTSGSPTRLLIGFTLPLLLGMLFQQFYSMVDTVVVGKFLGVEALAGVGSTGSIAFLVLGLSNGICAGFAIPVARKFGQQDFEGLRKFVGNMVLLSALLGAAITLATTLLCKDILIWMNTPADTFAYAYDYIFLIFLGIPATMLYNLLSGIIRSLGDSKTPLYFLILSSLLNVVLDILLIVGLDMGVAGAGWATLLSQLISGLLCLWLIAARFPILHLSKEYLRPDGRYIRHLLDMGLPMGMQYSITAIGSILLQTAINSLGAAAMAAVTAGGRVGFFMVTPFDAIGGAAATFAGQNLGAGKPERVHAGVRSATVMGTVYSLVILVVLYFTGIPMAQLFLDTRDPQVLAQILPMAQQQIMANALFYIPLLFVNLLRFTIQGLGFSGLAVFAGVFEMAARGIVGIALVPVFGYTAVCYANAAAWVAADIFLFPAYLHCMKKRGYDVLHSNKKQELPMPHKKVYK